MPNDSTLENIVLGIQEPKKEASPFSADSICLDVWPLVRKFSRRGGARGLGGGREGIC